MLIRLCLRQEEINFVFNVFTRLFIILTENTFHNKINCFIDDLLMLFLLNN